MGHRPPVVMAKAGHTQPHMGVQVLFEYRSLVHRGSFHLDLFVSKILMMSFFLHII